MIIPTITIVMAKLTISVRKFILLRLGISVLTTGRESWEWIKSKSKSRYVNCNDYRLRLFHNHIFLNISSYSTLLSTNTHNPRSHTTPTIYTVNHKKRDILFFTITLTNLNRFLPRCMECRLGFSFPGARESRSFSVPEFPGMEQPRSRRKRERCSWWHCCHLAS